MYEIFQKMVNLSTNPPIMRAIIRFTTLITVIFFFVQAEASAPQPQRKKVGLVLSGGGAKGVAHIGVLKVLEEAGIPIDYIAGNSMGAIVGGLYAIGYSPQALDSLVRTQNWVGLLADKITRDNLLFTEKEVRDKALFTIPFDRERFHISTGILSGSSVMDMLSELARDYHDVASFDSLPIPFACIAYDLISGDEVVMREGSLPVAIRASMSIPGAFSTVERNGQILIDGGVINNFPANVVREMGADIIIGVNVGMHTDRPTQLSKDALEERDPNSLMFIVNHMMERLGRENFDKNILLPDLYIHPNTEPYSTVSFTDEALDTLLARGEREARASWDNILAFKELIGIHPAEDLPWPPGRPNGADVPIGDSIKLGYIIFDGITSLNEKNLRRMLHFKEFSTVHVTDIRETISRLKGTGSFTSLQYSLREEGGRYNLRFHCTERARSAVSLGVRLDTRDVASGFINTIVAPRELKGGMFELNSRISTNPYVRLGIFYQDAWLGKFGASYTYRYGNINMCPQNDTTTYNVRFHKNSMDLDLANFYYRNFNFYFGLHYENFRSQNFLRSSNGVTERIRVRENLFSYHLGVRFDSYDNAFFPTSGIQFKAESALYTDDLAHYKEDAPFLATNASISVAIPIKNRFTLIPTLYARFLFGNEFAPHLRNLVGGTFGGHYLEHQMPLYGFKSLVSVDNKFVATGLKARYRAGKNHYVWLVGNIARISNSVLELIEWSKGQYMAGAALGYSYDSPLGPIDVVLEYGGAPSSRFGVFINLGKYF